MEGNVLVSKFLSDTIDIIRDYIRSQEDKREQQILFAKTFGCCRKIYNLMLADKIVCYV